MKSASAGIGPGSWAPSQNGVYWVPLPGSGRNWGLLPGSAAGAGRKVHRGCLCRAVGCFGGEGEDPSPAWLVPLWPVVTLHFLPQGT